MDRSYNLVITRKRSTQVNASIYEGKIYTQNFIHSGEEQGRGPCPRKSQPPGLANDQC